MSADLTTTYLGLQLECPLIASSSPLTGRLESLREIAEHGAAAVVLPSLFEEEVADEDGAPRRRRSGTPTSTPASARAYMAHVDRAHLDPYLDLVRDAKRELDIPVIASLNGSTPGGWTHTAELLQEAGADAIELNVYSVETDPYASGANVEERTLRLVHAMRQAVSVPIAVKLAPYYTAFANVAHRLADVPVDGLVLFNRFVQPDVDVAQDRGLARSRAVAARGAPHRLRWLAILHGRVDVSLAATGGVHTTEDAVKAILVGADAVMMTSALLRDGHRAHARRAQRPRRLARRERADARRGPRPPEPGRVRESPGLRARAVRRDDRGGERDAAEGRCRLRPSRGARSRSSTGADTISTCATASPSLRTVRTRSGSSRANDPGRSGWSVPSIDEVGLPSSTRNSSSWARSVSSCSGIDSPGGSSTSLMPNELTPSERRTSTHLP